MHPVLLRSSSFFTLIVELLGSFLFHGLRREELWAQCNWQQSVEFPEAFSDTNPEQVWRTKFYTLWNMIFLIPEIKLHLIPVRFLPNIIRVFSQKKVEIGGKGSTNGIEEKCIQACGWRIWRQETFGKHMDGVEECLKKIEFSGFIYFRFGTTGGHMWTKQSTVVCRKIWSAYRKERGAVSWICVGTAHCIHFLL